MPDMLVGLEVEEVSGVDKAANRRKWLVIKKEEVTMSDNATVEELAAKVVALETDKTKLTADLEAATKEPEIDDLEKALKSVPDSVKKVLAEGNKAKEELVKARADADAKVYVEKAEKLTVYGDEFGPTLQKIAGALGGDFEKFETKLEAVAKQADLGIAVEIGSKGEGETDTQKLIKQDIKKQMEDDSKLTRSAAMRRAMSKFGDKLNSKGE